MQGHEILFSLSKENIIKKGFSIIITNKGMLVHSDADINSTSEAKIS
ncbi:MAG: hypothetical protein Ct9H90mP18_04680 [Gammaproteobacteria bacterium]|nr:MAG: hypothetical protein Ct9H90mP18_04680 [Gammaproteobacteria bacterium]